MNKNTYDTIYSLINYYEDDYLLPLNRAELEAYKENTPAALTEAFKHWDLAVNAFEHLSKRVEMLCKRENAYLTASQLFELSNWIEDIESDVRYVGRWPYRTRSTLSRYHRRIKKATKKL